MTAFDSPLLVSKAAWLYARPADRQARISSDSHQQLLTLLERRRRKYLARKENRTKFCNKTDGDERASPSALEVDVDNKDAGMIQRRESSRLRCNQAEHEETPSSNTPRGRSRLVQSEESLPEPMIHKGSSTPRKATRTLCVDEGGVMQRYGEHSL